MSLLNQTLGQSKGSFLSKEGFQHNDGAWECSVDGKQYDVKIFVFEERNIINLNIKKETKVFEMLHFEYTAQTFQEKYTDMLSTAKKWLEKDE